MFISYILREAWKTVRSNGGAPGVDRVTIGNVEEYGVEAYFHELGEELRKQLYEPPAVKRVMIPKANGGERPLGIPKSLSYYLFNSLYWNVFCICQSNISKNN